jgi:hypothetical protein
MKENSDDEGLSSHFCLYNHVNKSSPISNSVYFRRPIGETLLITAPLQRWLPPFYGQHGDRHALRCHRAHDHQIDVQRFIVLSGRNLGFGPLTRGLESICSRLVTSSGLLSSVLRLGFFFRHIHFFERQG